MKKNKLFVMFTVSTLILGSAVPVAKAFADAEDPNTETTEIVSDEPAIPEVIETEDLADEVQADDNEIEENFVEETEPITEDTVDEEVNLPPSYEELVAEEETEDEYVYGTFEELGLDTKTLYALIAEVEYALNNRHLYTEDLQIPEAEVYDSYGWVVAENSVIGAYAALAHDNWREGAETNRIFNNQIGRLNAVLKGLVLLEDVETPETPEAQYTTATIELRGKDKGELLGTLTFSDQEIGSTLVIEFPDYEGLVTPPSLTVTVEEDHQLIVYYQTAAVVTPEEPDTETPGDTTDPDNEGEDEDADSENVDSEEKPDAEAPKPGDEDESEDKTPAEEKPEQPKEETKQPAKTEDKKPAEEAKKDSGLYTDATGLAKTSTSSKVGTSVYFLMMGAFLAILGAAAMFFDMKETR